MINSGVGARKRSPCTNVHSTKTKTVLLTHSFWWHFFRREKLQNYLHTTAVA